MGDIDDAEKAIADLRKTVLDLETEVDQVSKGNLNHETLNAGDFKFRSLSELVTQALLKVDSIHISKDLAADALRNGQRDKSRKVAVLLARRKTIVKKLNALGDRVDQLASEHKSSSTTTTTATPTTEGEQQNDDEDKQTETEGNTEEKPTTE